MTLAELQSWIEESGFFGVNIHVIKETGEWIVWTRQTEDRGWRVSGRHGSLEGAVKNALSAPAPSWKDASVREVEDDLDEDALALI